LGKRIPRIDDQIEQRRFELHRIGPHRPQCRHQIKFQGDVGTEWLARPAGGVPDAGDQIDFLDFERLLAGEGEQAAGEFGAMPAGVADPLHQLEQLRLRLQRVHQEAAIAEDRCQRLVASNSTRFARKIDFGRGGGSLTPADQGRSLRKIGRSANRLCLFK